jgi:hypothetical protein
VQFRFNAGRDKGHTLFGSPDEMIVKAQKGTLYLRKIGPEERSSR